MSDTLQLTIVTPERALVEEQVEQVHAPGAGGYLGILPGHAPLFSELAVGELTYTKNGRTFSLVIANGFMEVLDNEVRILADAAEHPGDIDLDRARRAQAQAQELITSGSAEIDYEEVQRALARAQTRIDVAGHRESR